MCDDGDSQETWSLWAALDPPGHFYIDIFSWSLSCFFYPYITTICFVRRCPHLLLKKKKRVSQVGSLSVLFVMIISSLILKGNGRSLTLSVEAELHIDSWTSEYKKLFSLISELPVFIETTHTEAFAPAGFRYRVNGWMAHIWTVWTHHSTSMSRFTTCVSSNNTPELVWFFFSNVWVKDIWKCTQRMVVKSLLLHVWRGLIKGSWTLKGCRPFRGAKWTYVAFMTRIPLPPPHPPPPIFFFLSLCGYWKYGVL